VTEAIDALFATVMRLAESNTSRKAIQRLRCLVWLLFSPVIAFALFANYYDRLLAHGINLLSLLVLSYLFSDF
jgi:hypothetical protein